MTPTMYQTSATSSVTVDRIPNMVMADDDRNDQLLMVMAAEEAGLPINFQFVDDGSDLMMLLASITTVDDLPDAIILDLRMPRLDGHRTLDRLQAHPVFWQIPVVVFTTSSRATDMSLSYDLGARGFQTKPSDFSGLVSFARTLATVAAERLAYTDDSGALADADAQLPLLGPDLGGDIDELFFEDIDLNGFDGA